ncbi:MAG: DUF2332 domain-containing protein [Solirubrobacteraceae bacterium]
MARRLRAKAAQMSAPGGSPLYADLLEHAAVDVESAGPTLHVLSGFSAEPPGSALVLRLLSAVHRLVLDGTAPELARHYPSAGGDAGRDGTWPAFRAVLEEHGERLRDLTARPCQTNDVGRCGALLAGFLAVADEFGLPLALLELGSSAGLNLNWDRYRYEAQGWAWGPRRSPVRLAGFFEGRVTLDSQAVVAARLGCDATPLDPADPDTRLALRASVWPDHVQRLELLDAGLEVARQHPPPVERADLDRWLEAQLSRPRDGAVTVVFHSIVWQYLDDLRRERVRALLAAAGAEAHREAPLAWLRMEPAGGGEFASVTLTTWPGACERVIARSGYHGRPVRLLS